MFCVVVVLLCNPQVRETGFGTAALGGSVVFTDPVMNLSVAVTVNELTPNRVVVKELVSFICRELDAGLPIDL